MSPHTAAVRIRCGLRESYVGIMRAPEGPIAMQLNLVECHIRRRPRPRCQPAWQVPQNGLAHGRRLSSHTASFRTVQTGCKCPEEVLLAMCALQLTASPTHLPTCAAATQPGGCGRRYASQTPCQLHASGICVKPALALRVEAGACRACPWSS